MNSRRRFLQMGSVAAGTIVGGLPALADAGRTCPPLPASIARLNSAKNEAKPITREERIARQEQARRLMKANHLSAILLADGTSLDYFTGIRWWGSERLFAMVLPASGPAFYVCPAFEEGRAREWIAKFADAKQADIRTWQEDEDPYQRVREGLKDRGISTGILGLEETVRFVFADEVAKAAPQVTIVPATPVTAGCRMIKSDHENRLDATGRQAYAHGLPSRVQGSEAGHDAGSDCGSHRDRILAIGLFWRGRRANCGVHRVSSRLGAAASDSRRNHHHDR